MQFEKQRLAEARAKLAKLNPKQRQEAATTLVTLMRSLKARAKPTAKPA